MRRLFTTFATAAGVLAISGLLYAQATPAPAGGEKQTAPKAAKAAKAGAHKATGEITKYDAASKTLTLKTKKGTEENFTLAGDATVNEGASKLTADDLGTKTGMHAMVTYTEAGGTMTATKVTIAKAKAAKSEAKEPKKEEPKK